MQAANAESIDSLSEADGACVSVNVQAAGSTQTHIADASDEIMANTFRVHVCWRCIADLCQIVSWGNRWSRCVAIVVHTYNVQHSEAKCELLGCCMSADQRDAAANIRSLAKNAFLV